MTKNIKTEDLQLELEKIIFDELKKNSKVLGIVSKTSLVCYKEIIKDKIIGYIDKNNISKDDHKFMAENIKVKIDKKGCIAIDVPEPIYDINVKIDI